MKALYLLLPLQLLSFGYAMDPPAISWVKNYFTNGFAYFLSISETDDGGFIAGGMKATAPLISPDSCLFRFSSSGDLLWSVGVDGYTWDVCYWIEELPDGAFISTGTTRETVGSSIGLFIQKVDSSGNQIWVKFYDDPTVTDQGNCVLPLEDGFAIAGNTGSNAWIIRTDSQGDSIWSAVYEGANIVNARRILKVDNSLIVSLSGIYPELLAFSIDDGQLIWTADDYPPDFGSCFSEGGDITCASDNDGFVFITSFFPYIARTDSAGDLLWYYEVPYDSYPYGRSISNTMDGGYIYGGVNTVIEPGNSPLGWSGMVIKYDSDGQIQWGDFVYECYDLFCIRQLSQGGYIACGRGNEGTLVRYAPETGITEPDPSSSLTLEVSPNPCSSVLSVSFSLPEPSDVSVHIFDLSGRMVSCAAQGGFAAGWNTVEWAVPEELSSGCYFVQYNSDMDSCTESFVLIK